jgi:hypothetical protein
MPTFQGITIRFFDGKAWSEESLGVVVAAAGIQRGWETEDGLKARVMAPVGRTYRSKVLYTCISATCRYVGELCVPARTWSLTSLSLHSLFNTQYLVPYDIAMTTTFQSK